MKKKTIITGASGYIGSYLAARLAAAGWEVHVVTRKTSNTCKLEQTILKKNLHVHNGTTSNLLSIIKQVRPELVFHLASQFIAEHKSGDVTALVQNNICFGNQLLEAMAANSVKRIITAGTLWQNYKNLNVAANLYAATKQAFESILTFYIDAYSITATTLYLPDVYGPKDPRNKLIPLLYRASKTGETLVMSAGEQQIDLVHIDDVVEAFMMAAEQMDTQNSLHAKYKITSGNPISLAELVHQYLDITKTNIDIEWGRRPYRAREVMTVASDLNLVPGWVPQVSFQSGFLSVNE